MKQPAYFTCLIYLFIVWSQPILAEGDSVKTKKPLKNTVRFNLTNPMIFGEKSIHFGYERVIGQHQSISLNVGNASFPKPTISVMDSAALTKIGLEKSYKDFGYNLTLDYRFYLRKENKYIAPRGVYIGPFASFMHFERQNNWVLTSKNFNGTLQTNLNMNIGSVGVQLGYQFVLWKRLALDFVLLGPGVAFYNFKTEISTQLNDNDSNELLQKLREGLTNRFPALEYVINRDGFDKSGTTNTTSLGFRYVIHLGFRF